MMECGVCLQHLTNTDFHTLSDLIVFMEQDELREMPVFQNASTGEWRRRHSVEFDEDSDDPDLDADAGTNLSWPIGTRDAPAERLTRWLPVHGHCLDLLYDRHGRAQDSLVHAALAELAMDNNVQLVVTGVPDDDLLRRRIAALDVFRAVVATGTWITHTNGFRVCDGCGKALERDEAHFVKHEMDICAACAARIRNGTFVHRPDPDDVD